MKKKRRDMGKYYCYFTRSTIYFWRPTYSYLISVTFTKHIENPYANHSDIYILRGMQMYKNVFALTGLSNLDHTRLQIAILVGKSGFILVRFNGVFMRMLLFFDVRGFAHCQPYCTITFFQGIEDNHKGDKNGQWNTMFFFLFANIKYFRVGHANVSFIRSTMLWFWSAIDNLTVCHMNNILWFPVVYYNSLHILQTNLKYNTIHVRKYNTKTVRLAMCAPLL